MKEIPTTFEKYTDFSLFEKFSIFLSDEQKSLLEQYYHILMEENAKYNLTSITQVGEVYEKHFLDSMLGAKFICENASVCDIGAGGGFPSIPLKILRPDLSFLLCDATKKKTNFLDMVVEKLNLDKMQTIHSRIEDLAHSKKKSSFDVCVSRGVAPLPTLLEYKIPLIKIGGIALCYKGDVTPELEKSKNAMQVLKISSFRTEKFEISENQSMRTLLIVDKSVDNPPKYPRRQNLCRSNPL